MTIPSLSYTSPPATFVLRTTPILSMNTMPTRSEESDLRLDRIQAREAHYQSGQKSSKLPTVKKRIDSIELGSIGAHFDGASEVESYPESIDDFTDETYPDCDSASKLRENIFRGQPDSNNHVMRQAPTESPRHGLYLPLSEVKEFRRQQSNNSKSTKGLRRE